MNNETPDTELFTKKHNRLINIANALKVIAFLTFIVCGVILVADFNTFFIQFAEGWEYLPVINMLKIIATFLKTLFLGIAVGVGLFGISSGLRMIVETDLNYRLKKEEANND